MRKLPRDSIFANVFWQCAVQFLPRSSTLDPLNWNLPPLSLARAHWRAVAGKSALWNVSAFAIFNQQ
jgi:hypothetical protein